MTNPLEETKLQIAGYLDDILDEVLVPIDGEEFEVTFIARHPSRPESWIVVTTENQSDMHLVKEALSKKPTQSC